VAEISTSAERFFAALRMTTEGLSITRKLADIVLLGDEEDVHG
jgi:hypothetical protein